MFRVALFLFAVLAVLTVLRALRVLTATLFPRVPRGDMRPHAIEGEMVRDPVCGTWIDRRLALAARNGEEWIPVCSEQCRQRLEKS
jgi:hypothetical protein